MKLSSLYKDHPEELAKKLMNALDSDGGSPYGGNWQKKRQDPTSPERQGYTSTDQSMSGKGGIPVQQYRSGNQGGTASKPSHKKFFGIPDSGNSNAIRPDAQMQLGAGETPVSLGPGDFGTSLRKR